MAVEGLPGRGTNWLPPSRVRLGTATVQMPDGSTQSVDVMIDPQWYRAFNEVFNIRLGGVTGEAIIRRAASLVGVHNYEGADLEEAVELIEHLHAAVLPEGAWARLFSPPQPLAALEGAMALAASGVWARVTVAPNAE